MLADLVSEVWCFQCKIDHNFKVKFSLISNLKVCWLHDMESLLWWWWRLHYILATKWVCFVEQSCRRNLCDQAISARQILFVQRSITVVDIYSAPLEVKDRSLEVKEASAIVITLHGFSGTWPVLNHRYISFHWIFLKKGEMFEFEIMRQSRVWRCPLRAC